MPRTLIFGITCLLATGTGLFFLYSAPIKRSPEAQFGLHFASVMICVAAVLYLQDRRFTGRRVSLNRRKRRF